MEVEKTLKISFLTIQNSEFQKFSHSTPTVLAPRIGWQPHSDFPRVLRIAGAIVPTLARAALLSTFEVLLPSYISHSNVGATLISFYTKILQSGAVYLCQVVIFRLWLSICFPVCPFVCLSVGLSRGIRCKKLKMSIPFALIYKALNHLEPQYILQYVLLNESIPKFNLLNNERKILRLIPWNKYSHK